MELELICTDCNMVFRSTELLGKHKALLCIGNEVGHLRVQRRSSELLMRDKPEFRDSKQTRIPDLSQLRAHRRKIPKPKLARAEGTQTSQTENAALQDLRHEFHKLRMSIEENLQKWSQRTTDTETSGRQFGHSERLEEMREMTKLHQHQLALIHTHNQELEQQRDELAHQMSVLSEQSNTTHLESVLMELREQEERNEEILQQISEHLSASHVREDSVHANQPDPCKNKKMDHDSYKLISSSDGPLSTQIKALWQAYMQSSGSDPAIVAQMIDLQVEARSLENKQPATSSESEKKKVKPPRWSPRRELLAVEQENQRLEEEILRIQLVRDQHQTYDASTELELIQRENLLQIGSLQAEMERSKEGPRTMKQPPMPPQLRPQTHIHAPLSLLQTRSLSSPTGRWMSGSLDSLGPAPYDPAAGFVVFYDLMLGVDVSQRALCLVAALYSEGQEVGPPTPLPPVQCLSGGTLPYTHSATPTNYALLSVKQPVPRIQPSASLSLVVEVQTAGDVDAHSQEVFKLASCGWTRMDLFDKYNQLRSGHWRLPVRNLPVRSSSSPAQLNSVPQVGKMELCVRLVNGRDADVQTLAKPDPTSTGHYKYPAVVGCPHVLRLSMEMQLWRFQRLSSQDWINSPPFLSYTDHQRPPLTESGQR
ncbi:coiled-coil domain-containing protein 17 [Anoplopoma fimbria]|uniref:coiled-coil domain-containing protein 17 n=1 Tax=Anoplopoma fimbria TaxID=229290 RepID=UPI0023ED9181|nr:coiled-coil domain-containing protein 17 [Anoplopoma fimbria]